MSSRWKQHPEKTWDTPAEQSSTPRGRFGPIPRPNPGGEQERPGLPPGGRAGGQCGQENNSAETLMKPGRLRPGRVRTVHRVGRPPSEACPGGGNRLPPRGSAIGTPRRTQPPRAASPPPAPADSPAGLGRAEKTRTAGLPDGAGRAPGNVRGAQGGHADGAGRKRGSGPNRGRRKTRSPGTAGARQGRAQEVRKSATLFT